VSPPSRLLEAALSPRRKDPRQPPARISPSQGSSRTRSSGLHRLSIDYARDEFARAQVALPAARNSAKLPPII